MCFVCRLAGLENTLLGYTSRNHQVVWRRARTSPSQVDVICFGHVLFEMAAGYELNQPQPSPGHLQLDLDRCPQVNMEISSCEKQAKFMS